MFMRRLFFISAILLLTLNIQSQQTASVTLFPEKATNKVSPMLFGQFIEFLGTSINGGVFEPGSPLSDENGFRKDVIEKVRELDPPLLRYPAGTYIKIFNWKNGIGPKENRPRTRNLIWGGVEDNQFGTAEFIRYCKTIGAEPFLVVNMSTASAMEAAEWVEYCNGTTDSHWANLRRSHGYPDPFNVKYWALGNEEAAEPDAGRLQDPVKYCEEAWQFVKLMKLQDPSIEFVLCGADEKWNRIILEKMSPVCSYLSVHLYAFDGPSPVYGSVFKSVASFEEVLESAGSLVSSYPEKVIDWNKWYRFPPREGPVKIALDEWGIWPSSGTGTYNLTIQYTWEHALATAQFINMIIRHSDHIGMATWAQMVNVLAPILTDRSGLVTQPPFSILREYRKLAGGNRLELVSESPDLASNLKMLDLSAVMSSDGRIITLFAVNLSGDEEIRTSVNVEGREKWLIKEITELNAVSVSAFNSLEQKKVDVVRTAVVKPPKDNNLTIPAHSVFIIKLVHQ